MAVQNFVIELIEALLEDKELALTEQDIRFYDKGTTAEADEALDDHIRWRNARYFNEDSNVIRSSVLMVQLSFASGTEYIHFQVGELYRIYRKSGISGVLSVAAEDIKSIKATASQNLALLNQLKEYEAIKEQLIIRPLNYDNNDKVLASGIFYQVGDIALVLYVSLGHTDQGSTRNFLSAMVTQEMFRPWKVDKAAAFQRALDNTMRLQPPTFCYVVGLPSSNHAPRHVRFMEDETIQVNFNNPLAPILTTEQEINGAVAAFYPGVLDRLYGMVGGDFYLVFSGIHDVHIHPVDGAFKPSAMRNTLANMNRNANKRDEVLSRKIYRYNGEKQELSVV